ncbi:Origin recognition complex subunit 5 C-terminal domain-containing protein [Pleurotus pulmonarius]
MDTAGYREFADNINTILSSPPPFLYIRDSNTPRITSSVLDSILSSAENLRYAHIDAVACFTPRLVFDSILNALARWTPRWSDGCANWSKVDASDESYNTSLGSFMRGLRDIQSDVTNTGKGKGKAAEDAQMVIFIENADRLVSMPNLMVPLTRLAELSQLDSTLSVIFLSRVRWEDIRPPLGASPDPFVVDVQPLTKDDATQFLEAKYLRICAENPCDAYNPSFLPLYKQFVSAVVGINFPFTHDPNELAYVIAAQWPHFIGAALREVSEEDALPDEPTRMRLLRSFTPSMTAGFESLYPRETHAADWVESLPTATNAPSSSLPRMHKYILLASYIASSNPPKTDLRMFGRGLDERGKKKKRKGGGGARQGAGKVAKVPQRLIGPSPFPLDRLVAILGALIEENEDYRTEAPESMKIPGEWTDMEVSRVGVLGTISELTRMRLLQRTTAVDKLDGPPVLKCAISYEAALEYARELGVPLADLLWETA